MGNLDLDLKIYIDERIEAIEREFCLKLNTLEENTNLRFKSIVDANEKHERLLEIRLNGLNEWREENRQQTARHASKEELESGLKIIRAEYNGRLKVLESLLVSLVVVVMGAILVHLKIGG